MILNNFTVFQGLHSIPSFGCSIFDFLRIFLLLKSCTYNTVTKSSQIYFIHIVFWWNSIIFIHDKIVSLNLLYQSILLILMHFLYVDKLPIMQVLIFLFPKKQELHYHWILQILKIHANVMVKKTSNFNVLFLVLRLKFTNYELSTHVYTFFL